MRFPLIVSALLVATTTTSCSDRPASGAMTKEVATKVATVAPVAAPPVAAPAAATKPTPTGTSSAAPVIEAPLEPPFTTTTRSGVYTADQAREGRDLYLGYCASCHAAVSHTGPAFRKKWAGRPLSDLFVFMQTNMPKNDPGSLDDYTYGVLLAYMLQMNKMPAGKTPLSPDPDDLAKIRIDTARAVRRKPPA